MSEFKGTKGKWAVYYTRVMGGNGEVLEITVMPNRRQASQHVSECWDKYKIGRNGCLKLDEAEHNARLIAAAPDMLSQLEIESEFLDEVIGMLKNNDAHSSNIQKVTDRRKRIEQQISEALGE